MPFATLDTNKDGKVSREEFRGYYSKNGISSLRFLNNNFQATQAKQINDSIYKRLHISPTGKMTREKLVRLQDLLSTLDENEDELLSSQELSMDSPPDPYAANLGVARRGKMPRADGEHGRDGAA